jgi:hypothetical protein
MELIHEKRVQKSGATVPLKALSRVSYETSFVSI